MVVEQMPPNKVRTPLQQLQIERLPIEGLVGGVEPLVGVVVGAEEGVDVGRRAAGVDRDVVVGVVVVGFRHEVEEVGQEAEAGPEGQVEVGLGGEGGLAPGTGGIGSSRAAFAIFVVVVVIVVVVVVVIAAPLEPTTPPPLPPRAGTPHPQPGQDEALLVGRQEPVARPGGVQPYPPAGPGAVDGPDARLRDADREPGRRGAGVAPAPRDRGGGGGFVAAGGVELEVAVDDVAVGQDVVLGEGVARPAGGVGGHPAPNGDGAGATTSGRTIVEAGRHAAIAAVVAAVVAAVGIGIGPVDLDEEPAGQVT